MGQTDAAQDKLSFVLVLLDELVKALGDLETKVKQIPPDQLMPGVGSDIEEADSNIAEAAQRLQMARDKLEAAKVGFATEVTSGDGDLVPYHEGPIVVGTKVRGYPPDSDFTVEGVVTDTWTDVQSGGMLTIMTAEGRAPVQMRTRDVTHWKRK